MLLPLLAALSFSAGRPPPLGMPRTGCIAALAIGDVAIGDVVRVVGDATYPRFMNVPGIKDKDGFAACGSVGKVVKLYQPGECDHLDRSDERDVCVEFMTDGEKPKAWKAHLAPYELEFLRFDLRLSKMLYKALALGALSTTAALRVPAPVMQMVGAPMQTTGYTGGVVPTRRGPAETEAGILVQGGSLRTWSYRSPAVEQVQVVLSTEGRPLDADIELWHGPDNTPCKMRVYVENGQLRPFSAVIETPRGPNTVAIRNIGQIEFPIAANVVADAVDMPSADCMQAATTVQGGALRTYPFDPSVDSVQVLLRTDGRPLNARIELLQGPNNNKQVIELYTEDGLDRPFFCVLETPGSGNVVRIVNTAPVEFPMTAGVVPHTINEYGGTDAVMGGDAIIGGDVGW